MALLYAGSGNLDLHAGGMPGLVALPRGEQQAIFWLLIAGFGVKAAIMPLHGWLPSAMVAPTPVSALLHAVAVVKSGVFGCVRVIGFVFGPALLAELGAATVLAWIAAATILLASVLALAQDSLKRRLAYSTVSQLSYIVLGAALLNQAGITGAALHLAYHASLKITLFFCAGAIYVATGCERVSQLGGIGRRMPLTMSAFALAALGLAGVPPLNGFFSKWYLCLAGIDADRAGMVAVLIASGILNLAYFLPIVYAAFFRSSASFTERGEAPPAMVVPLLLTAAASLALGLWPDLGGSIGELAARVARDVR
jgi:multicomponent Na+:H+ antiporter subunit D